MRFPNIFKGHALHKQKKLGAQAPAVKLWEEETKGHEKTMYANSQRHMSSGIGHHLARSMKGHV